MVLLDIGEVVSHFFLPLGVLVKRVLDVVLHLFYVCQPGVKAGMLHLLVMVAHWLIMITMSREGHVSSLIAIGDLLIGLLLIVVKIAILPLPT